MMPASKSRPEASDGIVGLTPTSESCGNRSRFPPVAVHARVIVCVLYRPATVVFRVSGEYPMSLSRFGIVRSEEHTSELQSLMRISYAVFCLKKKILLIINKWTVFNISFMH